LTAQFYFGDEEFLLSFGRQYSVVCKSKEGLVMILKQEKFLKQNIIIEEDLA